MSPPRHVRSAPHGKKVLPAHARPSKPAPIKTGKNVTVTTPAKSPAKIGPGWSKTVGKKEIVGHNEDEIEDDMAGLPSFCAFCEKQIVTPQSSLLYCSER